MTAAERNRRWYYANREEVIARRRELRIANPARYSAYQKKYYAAHREQKQDWQRLRDVTLKAELIAAYGGCCACCGENAPQFLTIDHVNRDGKQHRKALGGRGVYTDLKKRGWPAEGFRLLCMNCNWGTRYGAPCPHVEKRLSETALAYTAYEDNRDG